MGKAHLAVGGPGGGRGVGEVARKSVDVILVDVSELLVHGVAVKGVALVGVLLAVEVAGAHELVESSVGDHSVAPPVIHRPQVVVVVVRHRVPYLHYVVHN